MGPLDPSIPHDAVIIALGRAASMRCARACEAKPPKTAAWIAPKRVIANAAIKAAGIIGTRCDTWSVLDSWFSSIPHLWCHYEVVGLRTVNDNNITLLYPFLPKHTGKNLHLIE